MNLTANRREVVVCSIVSDYVSFGTTSPRSLQQPFTIVEKRSAIQGSWNHFQCLWAMHRNSAMGYPFVTTTWPFYGCGSQILLEDGQPLWAFTPLEKITRIQQKRCAKRRKAHEFTINISLVAEARTGISQVACKE